MTINSLALYLVEDGVLLFKVSITARAMRARYYEILVPCFQRVAWAAVRLAQLARRPGIDAPFSTVVADWSCVSSDSRLLVFWITDMLLQLGDGFNRNLGLNRLSSVFNSYLRLLCKR